MAVRLEYNQQYKELIKNIVKEIRCNKEEAELICTVEMVAIFLLDSYSLSSIEIQKVIEIFRLVSTSDLPNFSNLDKARLSKLQNLLPHWTYKTVVEKVYMEYSSLPTDYRIGNISFTEKKEINDFALKSSCKNNKRYKNYLSALEQPLGYKRNKETREKDLPEIADKEYIEYSYLDYSDKSIKKIYLKVPYIEYAKSIESSINIDVTPKKCEKIVIRKDELDRAAKDMDEQDKKNVKSYNWEKRVRDLVFAIPQQNFTIKDSDELTVDGIKHMVGALSVGKSTFIKICSYLLAKKGKRITLFFNTITEVLQTVDYFNDIGILAVPLLSSNQIKDHSNQYLTTLKSRHELFDNKPSFRYLSDSCLLVNSNMAIEGVMQDNEKPCTSLMSDEKKVYCPFIYSCPRYNNVRDLNDAQIVITTINSAVQSYLPTPFCDKKITILEYLIRTCDLAFIDESDRVQANLDTLFSTTIHLYGSEDLFYEKIMDRQMDYFKKGILPDSPLLIDFIKDTISLENYITGIIEFFKNTDRPDKLFSKDIFGKVIKSSMMWEELFFEAIGVSTKDLKDLPSGDPLKEQVTKARESFRESYWEFQSEHIRGLMEYSSKSQMNYLARTITSNIVDEAKLRTDIQRFTKLPLKNFFKHKRRDIEKYDKLEKLKSNLDRPLSDVVHRAEEKVRFILQIYMLEYKLKCLLQSWTAVKNIDTDFIGQDNKLPGILKEEFAGIVPALPVDVNYGFRIKEDNKSFAIDYYYYEGVGRWILLNFDKLYRDLDDVGINCILLSGTSNLEYSPKYYVDIPVSCLLRKKDANRPRLEMSFPAHLAVKVSGTYREDKIDALQKTAYSISAKEINPNGTSFLDSIIETLEPGRKRILFTLGSYENCKEFSKALNSFGYSARSLVRPGSADVDDKNVLERSNIEDVAKLNIKYLSIPLGIGRGYNIITESLEMIDESLAVQGEKTVAAMGAVFFIARPFYMPDDANTLLSWLNSIYVSEIKQFKGNRKITFEGFIRQLIKRLNATQRSYENMFGYTSLDSWQRNRLLGDTLVDVYQLCCRLIRGDVNAKIIFLDGSFAPNTFSCGNKPDSQETSMLIGWRELLKKMIQGENSIADKEINKELYSILLDGLNELKFIEGDVINV